MLGKQRIPTIATPGTGVAAETARIEPITHPGPCDGPKITWLSPEGRGKGYYPSITPSPPVSSGDILPYVRANILLF